MGLHDEGPATQAYVTGEPVVVELASDAGAWPVLVESALRQTGAAAVLALPMRAGPTVLGVPTPS